MAELEKQPQRITPIKEGWAAIGKGWAVHGRTMEEALRLFREAAKRHKEIDDRPLTSEEAIASPAG